MLSVHGGEAKKGKQKTQSKFKCRYCGHEDNADINAALNILAVGNTATGRGGSGVAWLMKRQKNEIAQRANQLVKLSV